MSTGNRHHTRQVILQAIYQWIITDNNIEEINAYFHNKMKVIDEQYFITVLTYVMNNYDSLEESYLSCANMDKKAVDLITNAILLIASYELKEEQSLDYKIIINEALLLAKEYGSSESYKFVNGVLEKLREQFRGK